VKRFGNKLRYFEMLQQGEARDRTLLDDLKARLRRFTVKDNHAGDAPTTDELRGEPNRRIAAPQLVALGALHEAFGPAWLSRFRAGVGSDLGDHFPTFSGTEDARLVDDAESFIAHHKLLFGTTWPPRLEEVEVFARLLDGIRLSGESEVLDMRQSSGYPPAEEGGDERPSSARPDVK
jgi:hypothetical protein